MLQVTLPRATYDKLVAMAIVDGISQVALARRLIEKHVQDYVDPRQILLFEADALEHE